MSKNKKKGDLLEDVVAQLHRVPNVTVTTRVRLPARGGGPPREVDVLLERDVSGYPVRIAIECKNWTKRVGVPLVDGFVGKLQQIGIPVSHGIMVSCRGFTRNALPRAALDGVRLLELGGLTPDGMDREMSRAFHSTLYVALKWRRMSQFPVVPSDGDFAGGAVSLVRNRRDGESTEAWGLRSIWECWNSGEIADTLGEHSLFLQGPAEDRLAEVLLIEVVVEGYVFTIEGHLQYGALRNAQTGLVERGQYHATFGDERVTHRVMRSEEELSRFLTQTEGVPMHIHRSRSRVPRLEMNLGWYPPSRHAMDRVSELLRTGVTPTFELIEGVDIRRAWDVPLPEEFWSRW